MTLCVSWASVRRTPPQLPTILAPSCVNFGAASNAGSAINTNTGVWAFLDTSTAGGARISNKGTSFFKDNSGADSAAISNDNNALLDFSGNSKAFVATITNDGNL